MLLRANAEIENPLLDDKEKKLASSRRKNSGQRIRKIVVPPPNGRPDSFGSQWFAEAHVEQLIDVGAMRTEPNIDRPDFSSVRRCIESSLSFNQRRQQQALREQRMCSEHNVSLVDCGCQIDEEVNESRDADEKSPSIKPDCCRKASLLGDADEITCSNHGNKKPFNNQSTENPYSSQESENPRSSRYEDNRDSTEDHKREEASGTCVNISRYEVKRILARNRMNNKLMAMNKDKNTSGASEIAFLDHSQNRYRDPILDAKTCKVSKMGKWSNVKMGERKISPILTDVAKVEASPSNAATNIGNRMVVAAPCENPSIAGGSKDFESERKNNLGAHCIDNEIYSGEDNGIDPMNSGMSSPNLEKATRKNGLAGHRLETICNTSYLKRSAEENDREESHARRIRSVSCDNDDELFRQLTPEEFRRTFGFDESEDYESDSEPESYHRDYLSCYTYRMTEKIGMLPLPLSLKLYLNFSRPL